MTWTLDLFKHEVFNETISTDRIYIYLLHKIIRIKYIVLSLYVYGNVIFRTKLTTINTQK